MHARVRSGVSRARPRRTRSAACPVSYGTGVTRYAYGGRPQNPQAGAAAGPPPATPLQSLALLGLRVRPSRQRRKAKPRWRGEQRTPRSSNPGRHAAASCGHDRYPPNFAKRPGGRRPPPPSGGTSTDPGRRHRLHLRVGMATSREDSVVAEMGSNGERCSLPVLVGTHHAARCERRTRRVCPPNRILLSGTPSVWKLAWRAVFPLSLQPAPARTIPYTFLSVFFRWSPALALVSPNEGRRSGVTPLTDWRYGLPRRPAPRRCGRRPRLLLSWPLARGGLAALCLLLQRVPVEGCVWRMEGEGPGGMERVRSACLRCLPSPAAVRPRMACHQGRANPPWVCSLTERRLSLRPVPAPHPHSPHKARRPGGQLQARSPRMHEGRTLRRGGVFASDTEQGKRALTAQQAGNTRRAAHHARLANGITAPLLHGTGDAVQVCNPLRRRDARSGAAASGVCVPVTPHPAPQTMAHIAPPVGPTNLS